MKKGIISLLFIILLFLLWELSILLGLFSPLYFSAPSKIMFSLFSNIKLVLLNLLVTLKHIAVGYFIGAVCGILVGIGLNKNIIAKEAFSPLIFGIGFVPVIIYVPMLIVWFGLNEIPIYVCSSIASFYPIFLATFYGIKKVEDKYLEVAQNFKVKKVYQRVILPAAFPYLSSGLRQGIQMNFLITPVAEMVLGSLGLGGLILKNADLFRIELVFVGIFVLGFVGWILYGIYTLFEQHFLIPWLPGGKNAKSE